MEHNQYADTFKRNFAAVVDSIPDFPKMSIGSINVHDIGIKNCHDPQSFDELHDMFKVDIDDMLNDVDEVLGGNVGQKLSAFFKRFVSKRHRLVKNSDINFKIKLSAIDRLRCFAESAPNPFDVPKDLISKSCGLNVKDSPSTACDTISQYTAWIFNDCNGNNRQQKFERKLRDKCNQIVGVFEN